MTGYIERLRDKKAGVLQVNSNTGNGKEFTVSLYSGDTFLYSKVFKIVQDVFSGGDGSEKNPYFISNKDDFLYFCRESAYWGKHFKGIAATTTKNYGTKFSKIGYKGIIMPNAITKCHIYPKIGKSNKTYTREECIKMYNSIPLVVPLERRYINSLSETIISCSDVLSL